ncbi:MAG: hypothetical protein HQ567_29810 [Candidatus Nealsonbacteria bacterium]|nr:hypothetical protein [Candidatus Nealsonbacteria bacterium]
MSPCRIVLVEDQKNDRNMLADGLHAEYRHEVKPFRDLRTLEQANEDKSLRDWETGNLPLVVVLDIMLAEDLDDHALYAPRQEDGSSGKVLDEKKCVDDELGIGIAAKIREGEFKETIPSNTAILFFTARMKQRVSELLEDAIEEPGCWDCLEKPAFLEDVQEKICELSNKAKNHKKGE